MDLTRDRLLIVARVRLLRTEDGGLPHSLSRTFRPSWDLGNRTEEGALEINDGEVTLTREEALSPGQEAEAFIQPLVTESWLHVQPGMVLPMHAGAKVLGSATVQEVVRVPAGR
jgi:hypothetical protein